MRSAFHTHTHLHDQICHEPPSPTLGILHCRFIHFWMLPPGFVFQVQACRSAPNSPMYFLYVIMIAIYPRLGNLFYLLSNLQLSITGSDTSARSFFCRSHALPPSPYRILILTYSGPSPAGGAVCVFAGAQPQCSGAGSGSHSVHHPAEQ